MIYSSMQKEYNWARPRRRDRLLSTLLMNRWRYDLAQLT
jgi:hypothetical protein